MFGRKTKRIEELEHEVAVLKCQLKEADSSFENLVTKLEVIQNYADTEPADCIPGVWCESCIFRKTFHYDKKRRNRYGFDEVEHITICGKVESCKHYDNGEPKEAEMCER